MDPGKLRHTVCLQYPVSGQDEYGKSFVTWQPVATVHAMVQSSAGTETVDFGQITASITHIVTMRWYPRLTSHWRVVWGKRVLQIIEVKNDVTARKTMTLKCSEVVDGAGSDCCSG